MYRTTLARLSFRLLLLVWGGLLFLPGSLLRAAGQIGRKDSLLIRLRESNPDTNRVALLLALGRQHLPVAGQLQLDIQVAQHFVRQRLGDLKQADRYAREAETLARSLDFTDGILWSRILRARVQLQEGKRDEARQQLEECRAGFEKLNRLPGLADAYYLLGGCNRNSVNDTITALNQLNRALTLYGQLGNGPGKIRVLREMADVLVQNGKNSQALALLQQSLREEATLPEPQPHYSYFILTQIYAQLNQHPQALRYAQQAIRNAQALRDTSMIQAYYQRLGRTCFALRNYAESVRYHRLALGLYQQDRNDYMVVHNTTMVSQGLIAQKKYREAMQFALENLPGLAESTYSDARSYATLALAQLYVANGDLPKARTYALRLPDPDRQLVSYPPVMKAGAHQEVGALLVSVQAYPQARHHLSRALELLQQGERSPLLLLSQVHQQLFKVDSAQGNYLSAIAHYQQYKAWQDSTFNEHKSRQISRLQVQFETEKKEQDIRLLQQKNQLQAASIAQARFGRNVLLVIVLLVLLLAGVLYNRYRLKQRSNRRLQIQQEELETQQEELISQQEVISLKNEYLSNLLAEKEWLVKEVHHRVKNNLQVIMSLLGAQTRFLTDANALIAIEESRHRVYAMSLIHQKLYQTDTLTGIQASEYLREMIGHLNDSLNPEGRVQFRLDIDPVELDVAVAVPMGLIVNEAITNALKYAFPGEREGLVDVSLKLSDGEQYVLQIRDNGVGVPEDFDPRRPSLGLSIMRGLTKQLNGEFTMDTRQGTRIDITFNELKIIPGHAAFS